MLKQYRESFVKDKMQYSLIQSTMKKAQTRFSIVNSYKKEQSIELIGKLTVEQLHNY